LQGLLATPPRAQFGRRAGPRGSTPHDSASRILGSRLNSADAVAPLPSRSATKNRLIASNVNGAPPPAMAKPPCDTRAAGTPPSRSPRTPRAPAPAVGPDVSAPPLRARSVLQAPPSQPASTQQTAATRPHPPKTKPATPVRQACDPLHRHPDHPDPKRLMRRDPTLGFSHSFRPENKSPGTGPGLGCRSHTDTSQSPYISSTSSRKSCDAAMSVR